MLRGRAARFGIAALLVLGATVILGSWGMGHALRGSGASSAYASSGAVHAQESTQQPGTSGLVSRSAAELEAELAQDIEPLLQQHCFDCHSGDDAEAGVDLAAVTSLDPLTAKPARFEKALKLVRAGAMPPAEMGPLSADEKSRLTTWLDQALDYAAAQLPPETDRPTIRRLNRAEYDNTVRDLLGLTFSPSKDFPSDEVGYGFDNIGDVLSVSPLHLERYLDAAESIAAAAINADAYRPFAQEIAAPEFTERNRGVDMDGRGDFQLSRTSEVATRVSVPIAAEYVVTVQASADQAGDENAKMEIRAGDKLLTTVEVTGRRRMRSYEVKATLPPGEIRLAAAFVNDYYNADAAERNRDRNLQVRSISLERIGDPDPASLPAAQQHLITGRPTYTEATNAAGETQIVPDPASVQVLSREFVARFAPRAFRRPVADAEVERYAKFVSLAVEQGETFERGVQVALTAMLVSPHFLYHIEGEPLSTADAPATPAVLANYALASRLSYFLWSTLPDEELFDLAAAGKLQEADVLQAQVHRMLADERSAALVSNFAGQWLNLRRLDEIAPDDNSIPGLDSELKSAMRRETELLFTWVLRENRPVSDLLDAPVTFVNERLAKHYGIAGIQGPEFRQVDLGDTSRAGLLTQASILTITSNPTRTSPVKRGKWILENILGDAPPDPPPNVPTFEETAKSQPDLPLREQLQIHRQDATCNSCHQLMDELGFGFERFGPLGQNRDHDDAGKPVDAAGVLPSGERFTGSAELIQLLKSQRSQDFVRCFAEKMFTYALGRGVTRRDRPILDQIVANAAADDYRLERIVTEIVQSQSFAPRRQTAGAKP